MAGKLPNVTKRIDIIERAVALMKEQLKDAEGERLVALKRLISEGETKLVKLRRHVVH